MKDWLRHNLRALVVTGAIVVPVALYAWWHLRPSAPQFVTVPVGKGSVVRAVVTTGAVNPVVTVQVGSYVSGVIQTLYCDYNTEVKAGQLCAKIDPRPFQVVVDQNAANLASGEAQLRKDQAALVYAKINYARDQNLQKRGIASQDTVDNDKSALDQATAQVGVDEAAILQHKAALSAAQVNLDYTSIISPVDGIVVSRSVDVGQTVAASFQTPTLFLIAKDLTKMQIDTNVSESDVGVIKDGQRATFTVEAYPGRTYAGKVTQLRQAPITVQNVVTYDVVVSLDNTDLTLLPGMTANARIVTDERDDVLRVPVTALKFTPSASRRAAASADERSAGHASPASDERSPAAERNGDHARGAGGDRTAGGPAHESGARPDGTHARGEGGEHGGGRARGEGKREARVWVLRDGTPEPVPVTTGLSDSSYVEITGGDLHEGDAVIVNEVRADAAKSASRNALSAPPMPGGGGRRF